MNNKTNNKIKGNYGEEIAAKELMKKGYQILLRNFYCKIGEIDIIARDGETIVFVEVKLRNSISHGFPGQAVDLKKRHHIIKTALFYLQQNDLFDCDVRFDIYEIVKKEHTIWGRHIVNAFDIKGNACFPTES